MQFVSLKTSVSSVSHRTCFFLPTDSLSDRHISEGCLTVTRSLMTSNRPVQGDRPDKGAVDDDDDSGNGLQLSILFGGGVTYLVGKNG